MSIFSVYSKIDKQQGQRPVVTSSSLIPDFVLAIVHSASLVLRRGTVCHPRYKLHQHIQKAS